MKNCVIAGGGIAGLFAAILAAEHYDSVTLVESEPHCGGLLRSWTNDDGVVFDFGTHIPCESAYPQINQILFKGMYDHPEDWHFMDITRVSNSFQGKRYETSQFMPLHFMADGDYQRALVELLAGPGLAMADAAHFEQYSLANYGQTITDKIFRPLMRKLQNAELDQLHASVHTFFALTRFVPGDAELCRQLKQSPLFDQKLSFASYEEGLSGSTKFYPKKRGIVRWVNDLLAQAEQKGVIIRTSCQIAQLQQAAGKITGVTLKEGEYLPCDQLIWTIPPIFALRQLGIPYQGVVPKFCPMTLHHLVFDRPFLDGNYYSNLNDAQQHGFRLTLYPNVTLEQPTGPYNCTVEVLCSAIEDKDKLTQVLVEELKSLAYVAGDAQLVSAHVVDIPMGFPQFTHEFVAEKHRQIDLINDTVDNITLIGKASKDEFFIHGILFETWTELQKLFGQPVA